MNYRTLLIKRKIESALISPFILVGKIMAAIKPLPESYRVFFFFPFYHTGGAEKIHAQIARACGGKDCIIFFTRKSQHPTFYNAFLESGCTIKDISKFTDNKFIYFVNFILRGVISQYINQQKIEPIVFNGHSNFAYKIAPWLKKNIKQVDLVHSLNSFSYIRIPYLSFYQKTVLISKVKLEAHKKLYHSKKIPQHYFDRFVFIPNAAVLPHRSMAEKKFESLKVLFSGRCSAEKRFHLFLSIASKIHQVNSKIEFAVIGNMEAAAIQKKYPFINFYGELDNVHRIQAIYFQSHILLLTSDTEGFPLVVIEAMANGCAIVATPVGDLPLHIKNAEEGFLFSTIDNEARIVNEGVDSILKLYADKSLLKKIAAQNIDYAQQHFSIERFNAAYQSLIKN